MAEVWCVTLWEMRKRLINHFGYAAGNNLALQLVTEGMALGPDNPTFIEARDAIVQALIVNIPYCQIAWDDVWAAFAKRGMGWGANAPTDPQLTSPVNQSFVPLEGTWCE